MKEEPEPTTGFPGARTALGLLVLTPGFLVLYLAFSPPGLVGGDATELIYGLDHFQTVHPPGYPLYLILGRAFLRGLSVGAVPGAHWLSGLYGSLTLAGLFLFLRRRGIRLGPALGTVVFVGFTVPFWSVAVRAEVYTLMSLLFVVSLILWWEVRNRGRGRRLLWFVAGLNLTHHPLGLLGVLLALDATRSSTGPFRIQEALLFLLPGALYLLLLVPGSGFPFNWPQVGNPVALWEHMTGGSFHRFLNPTEVGSLLVQGGRVLIAHLVAFPGIFLVLWLLGYAKTTDLDWTLIYLQVVLALLMVIYTVPDVADFLIPSYLLGAGFVARTWNRWRKSGGVPVSVLVLLLGVLSLAGMGWTTGFPYNWRDHRFPRKYIQSAQRNLEKGVVLSDWSHYTLLRYAQLEGEGLEDVFLPSPTHRYENWAERIRYHHRRGRAVYVTHTDWPRPGDLQLKRRGYLYRVIP